MRPYRPGSTAGCVPATPPLAHARGTDSGCAAVPRSAGQSQRHGSTPWIARQRLVELVWGERQVLTERTAAGMALHVVLCGPDGEKASTDIIRGASDDERAGAGA